MGRPTISKGGNAILALLLTLLLGGFATIEPTDDIYIVTVFSDYHALVEKALNEKLDGRSGLPYSVGYQYCVDWSGYNHKGHPVVYRLLSPTVEGAIARTEFARGYATFLYSKRGGL